MGQVCGTLVPIATQHAKIAMKQPTRTEATRARIIEAAGGLFAERGYHGVTIRDVMSKGDASLSALGYHFKDKEGLYRAVLTHACESDVAEGASLEVHEDGDARQALVAVCRTFIADFSDPATDWRDKLLERECIEPSPVFKEIFQKYYKPQFDAIKRIVARAAGRRPDERDVEFASIAIYGAMSIFLMYRRLFDHLAPGLVQSVAESPQYVERVADAALVLATKSARASRPAKASRTKPRRGA
jgi:TetR/AcrR family transcriptional regulator, regulator of cefoperazone and chloramphenicol sensitivity